MVDLISTEPSTQSVAKDVWLQRLFAIPFLIVTPFFAIAIVGVMFEIARGDFRNLAQFSIVFALGSVTCSLAWSLIRGRGVATWIVRLFLFSCAVATSFGCVLLAWEVVQGQRAVLDGTLLSLACAYMAYQMFHYLGLAGNWGKQG